MKVDGWKQKSDMTRLALQHSNENLESRITKIRSNVKKLEREVLALSRHIKDASSPFLGTWEADLLTRLIEVSYIRQTAKFPPGVSISETNFAERDVLSRAYSNAARRVKLTTILRLGLEEQHYEAVQNYSDVS